VRAGRHLPQQADVQQRRLCARRADDAPRDTPDGSGGPGSDGAVGQLCLGTFVKVCVATPTTALTLSAQTINTANAPQCVPYTATPSVDACVIAGSTITIPSANKVSVTGAKRLILIASDTILINGTLDAASHHGGPNGPAGNSGPCSTLFTSPTTSTEGGVAGAEGSATRATMAGTRPAVAWAALAHRA